MKKFVHIFWLFALVLFATSCEKDKTIEVAATGIELLSPYPEAVILEGGVYEIKQTDIHYIHARLSPRDATDKVIWSSDDETIAAVKEGYVIGVSEGTTTIRANVEGRGLSASVQVTVGGGVDVADLIAGPYRGDFGGVPNVVASLTRITSKTVEFKTSEFELPTPLGAPTTNFIGELEVSMNLSGDIVLSGKGNISYQNFPFEAKGTVDTDGNLVLDIEVDVSALAPGMKLPFKYTAQDAAGMAGTYSGTVTAPALAALGLPPFTGVKATITRTSPTTIEVETAHFSVPTVGTGNMDCALTISLNQNMELIFNGTGNSSLGVSDIPVVGKIDEDGNVVITWDFSGAGFGTFTYTGGDATDGIAGAYSGFVTAPLLAAFGLSPIINDVDATIIRTSPTTIIIETEEFSVPGVGTGNMDGVLTISYNENWELTFSGAGNSSLGVEGVPVVGKIDGGNIVITWDFGEYSTFTYTATLP